MSGFFLYNNRATKDNPSKDADRFDLAIRQVVGKRLTLCGANRKGRGTSPGIYRHKRSKEELLRLEERETQKARNRPRSPDCYAVSFQWSLEAVILATPRFSKSCRDRRTWRGVSLMWNATCGTSITTGFLSIDLRRANSTISSASSSVRSRSRGSSLIRANRSRIAPTMRLNNV